MRVILLLAALMLAYVPVAAADSCAQNECPCPTYTHRVGTESTGAAFNEQGQAYVAAGGWYVVVDEAAGLGPRGALLSIWVYPESNGREGLQREDSYCDNCPDWMCDSDTIIF